MDADTEPDRTTADPAGSRDRSVADLAYRYASAGADDRAAVLARAEANDVAIPVLERLVADATGDEARALGAELRRRRATVDRFDRDLERVDDLLSDAGIRYAAIKTNVAHAHRPWDLNVLVAERDWPRAHERLVADGWRRTTLRAHPLARLEPGKRLYERDDRHPVHLHAAVSWNGLTYLPASTVLDASDRVGGVTCPDPVVDATIRCAHSVFENFALTLGEALEITRVLGEGGADAADARSGRGADADADARSGRGTDADADARPGRRADPDDHACSGRTDPRAPRRASERGRELAAAHGWSDGYDLALREARMAVASVRRSPAAEALPRTYALRHLLRAWLGHARRTDGGWYELPLNAALWAVE